MRKVLHKSGSVFLSGSQFLAQANNALGKMGSGIALEFVRRYPQACSRYEEVCRKHLKYNQRSPLVGTAIIAKDDATDVNMICLITSHAYGRYVDSPKLILEATDKAIQDLLLKLKVEEGQPIEIHSNKFNSGLFRVPWEESEKVIEKYLNQHPNLHWVVWSG
jgi:ADP-ribose 1''-phosphate phosphatase